MCNFHLEKIWIFALEICMIKIKNICEFLALIQTHKSSGISSCHFDVDRNSANFELKFRFYLCFWQKVFVHICRLQTTLPQANKVPYNFLWKEGIEKKFSRIFSIANKFASLFFPNFLTFPFINLKSGQFFQRAILIQHTDVDILFRRI